MNKDNMIILGIVIALAFILASGSYGMMGFGSFGGYGQMMGGSYTGFSLMWLVGLLSMTLIVIALFYFTLELIKNNNIRREK